MTLDLAKLRAPFFPWDIHWRVQRANPKKTLATVLCYIDARDVMDRLDEVIGPENWQDRYTLQGGSGGLKGRILCTLSLRVGDDWIEKTDGAGDTNIEAEKGGLSDAFKRAGYKWGIGRYLHQIEGRLVVPIRSVGKTQQITDEGLEWLRAWYAHEFFDGKDPGPAPGVPKGQRPPPGPPTEAPSESRPAPVGSEEKFSHLKVGFGRFKDQTWGELAEGSPGGGRESWVRYLIQQIEGKPEHERTERDTENLRRCRIVLAKIEEKK